MKGRMMEKESRKPNTIRTHNAPVALLSFVKSATGDRSGC